MFNAELIKDYLATVGADVSAAAVEESVAEGNKLSSLSPSERLKLIGERLDLRNVTIGKHQSIGPQSMRSPASLLWTCVG